MWHLSVRWFSDLIVRNRLSVAGIGWKRCLPVKIFLYPWGHLMIGEACLTCVERVLGWWWIGRGWIARLLFGNPWQRGSWRSSHIGLHSVFECFRQYSCLFRYLTSLPNNRRNLLPIRSEILWEYLYTRSSLSCCNSYIHLIPRVALFFPTFRVLVWLAVVLLVLFCTRRNRIRTTACT